MVREAVKREEERADEAERRSDARAEAAERRADVAILEANAREERADSRVEAAERRAVATIVSAAARADEAEARAGARVEAAERRAHEAEAKIDRLVERLLEAKKEEGKFEALQEMPQISNLPQFLCELWPMWRDQAREHLRRGPATPRLLTHDQYVSRGGAPATPLLAPATPRPIVLSLGQQDGATSFPASASGDVTMEQGTTAIGKSKESLARRDGQQN